MIHSVISLTACLVILPASVCLADLTYVDATSGQGGNTTLADGSVLNPPTNGTTGIDNTWEWRSPFASGGTVLESGGESPGFEENAPEIRTTLSGLNPGVEYRVFAYFWDPASTAEDWSIRAGFASNPGANTVYSAADATGELGSSAAIAASEQVFASPPTVFSESDRTLLAAPIGTALADGSGNLQVFLDDRPAGTTVNLRTWYDGLAYEEAVAGPSDAVTYLEATAGPSGNTRMADGGIFTPAANGNTGFDNNWEERTGLASGASVFESGGEGSGTGENAPELKTTITGLNAGTDYSIYVFFWDPTSTGESWNLRVGRQANPGSNALFTADDAVGQFPGATPAVLASSLTYQTQPTLFSEGGRALLAAPRGIFTANDSGEIEVYIDDLPTTTTVNQRSWYDGIGYRTAEELDPDADQDGDGLTNAEEASEGTDAFVVDTDGDGVSDSVEVAAGSDPLDSGSTPPPPPLPGGAIPIAPDGVWTWFNDERAIFHQGSLFSGYVKSDGHYGVTRYDPATNTSHHMVISTGSSRQQDDHNNPSFTVLPDGNLMVLYAKHLGGNQFYQRTSLVNLPSDDTDWGPEIVRPVPANNTYNNTYMLSAESNRIYNFHRSINFNPTITVSDSLGDDWESSVQFIDVGSGGVRPYPRYCSNKTDRIDLIYTDGHPRDVNNSVFHMYYQTQTGQDQGAFYKTDGTLIDDYENLPLDHEGGQRGNLVYQYSSAEWGPGDGPDDWIPTGRGWTWDVHYGADGHPVCVFQVQVDNVTGSGWNHDRIYYYYARWDGTEWQRKFIAHGGRGIYSSEDDYGGGMCLDPSDPNVVYLASNAADPFDLSDIENVPLRADSRYEIWRGITSDGGLTFTWEQITVDSGADNLRPIVPEDSPFDKTLVWFFGSYETYTNYNCQVLALLRNELKLQSSAFGPSGVTMQWRSSPGESYRIGASTNLEEFPLDAATGVSSQGASTSQFVDYPAPLQGSPKGFFRVEEE